MLTYEFAIVLDHDQPLIPDVSDELLAVGCLDGEPGIEDGLVVIDFHRGGSSLEAAIRSAVADVERAGLRVSHVQIERLAVLQPA